MKKVHILMYHQVGDFHGIKTHRAVYCHHKRFASQMAYLHRFGYRVIALDQAVRGLFHGGELPARAVVLTFDDGYRNFYQYAAPTLQRYKFPATVFLLSGLIGGKSNWLADDGHSVAELMDAPMIRELHQAGIDFGSHGRTHVRLSKVSRELAREEIFTSKKELEDLLGSEVTSLCYPYGDYDQKIIEMTREAGYTAGLSCIRATTTRNNDPLLLPRKAISFGDNLLGYFWKLHRKDKVKGLHEEPEEHY